METCYCSILIGRRITFSSSTHILAFIFDRNLDSLSPMSYGLVQYTCHCQGQRSLDLEDSVKTHERTDGQDWSLSVYIGPGLPCTPSRQQYSSSVLTTVAGTRSCFKSSSSSCGCGWWILSSAWASWRSPAPLPRITGRSTRKKTYLHYLYWARSGDHSGLLFDCFRWGKEFAKLRRDCLWHHSE